MKETRSITLLIVVMMLVLVTRSVGAQSIFELSSAEPKYTPADFRPAPETMHTRFGTLEFPGGYPMRCSTCRRAPVWSLASWGPLAWA